MNHISIYIIRRKIWRFSEFEVKNIFLPAVSREENVESKYTHISFNWKPQALEMLKL